MPASELLLAGIEAAVVAAPDRLAVCDSSRRLTYAELWEASSRAAGALRQAEVGRGDRVAVVGDKRVETVAVLLGVLRLGAAFLPLDPGAPPARRQALLADAAPVAVVGPDALSVQVVLDGAPARGLPDVGPDDIAYCMYTSGSSGRPKGVQIDHGAVAAFVEAVDHTAQVRAGSRCLNTSPFFFDVSVLDVWYPLARGASVYLTDSFLVPDRVLDLIERERLTHVVAVAAVLAVLRRARRPVGERDLSSVARIVTGADVADPGAIREWLSATPTATIVNCYGPTEATCCCLGHEITVDNANEAPYPIGRPFPGVATLVVDADDRPCPVGAIGELLLAGPQLTAGYLNRPAENEAKFVERDGRRWYRTGDLVVQDTGGSFHFKGRADHELKVRGYRIHPAEVVTALQQCDGVGEAHVTATTDDRGERILVAAVAPLGNAALSADELRDHLRAALPDYMVPRRITVLPALPKLPSGKVDDRAVAVEALA